MKYAYIRVPAYSVLIAVSLQAFYCAYITPRSYSARRNYQTSGHFLCRTLCYGAYPLHLFVDLVFTSLMFRFYFQ